MKGVDRQTDGGSILIAILILLVLATMFGVNVLSTSSLGMKQAGSFRGRQSLESIAETGVNIALLRLQSVALDTDGVLHPSDLMGICSPTLASTPPGTGGICASPNPACPKGNPDDTDKNVITSNVICNFMGTVFQGGRVSLVRKDDYTDSITGNVFAQFLFNVIASDAAGRVRILQAGVMMQYIPIINPTTPILVSNRSQLNF